MDDFSRGLNDAVLMQAGLDALRVGLLVTDHTDTIVHANDHFVHQFARAPSPVGLSVAAYLDAIADDIVAVPSAWLAGRTDAATCRPVSHTDIRLKDGRIFEIKERRLAVPGSGRVSLWCDVTALRLETARLRDAIETSCDGFCFTDAHGAVQLWDPEFALALCGQDTLEDGADLHAVLSDACAVHRVSLHDPDALAPLIGALPDAHDLLLEHEDGRSLRLRVRASREGGWIATLTDLTAIRAQGDAVARRGVALAEATAALRESRNRLRTQTASLLGLKDELQRARHDAAESERARQAFMRTVSHELRTPLNAIIGFAEIVEHEACGPIGSAQYRDYGRMIHEGGARLLRVINRILDISRLEGGVALQRDPEALGPIVRRVVSSLEPHAHAAKISVRIDIPETCPWPVVNAAAMRTVVENLVENAFAYSPEGGVVTISACEQGDYVTLRVFDTGAGIAPLDLDRVLGPFEKAGTPVRQVGDGAGLGLAIVRALVEAMDGALELVSAVGRGTEAIVTLPTQAQDDNET